MVKTWGGLPTSEVPDTLTGRIQGVVDLRVALLNVAYKKEVDGHKRVLLAGLCHQLQQITPKRVAHEEWGSF